jgi:type I restriction enzyme S subunit
LFKNPNFRRSVTAYANGTTVNMLPRDGLQYPLIVVPPPKIVQCFENIAIAIFEKIELNEEENVKLTTTRDYLLPKLLSGKIAV